MNNSGRYNSIKNMQVKILDKRERFMIYCETGEKLVSQYFLYKKE